MLAEVLRERRVAQILAGGPGSGCHGGNCGRPRGVKKVYQTSQGFTYSILKPSRKGMAKGSHAWKSREDQFKGKYDRTWETTNTLGDRGQPRKGIGSVYDAAWGKGDRYEGHGKTIFVHRDFKNMRAVIQEIPHDELGKHATMRTFKFKNFGQAAAFLNKRYGIRQAFPKAKAAK